MGFGHRVYKNFDPRAKIIKQVADEVFEVTGRNPLLDIALELERIALADDYFIEHKLYPNVDFYSGIIYQAMGFPVEMFPVLFAIGRMPGWLAQWEEMLLDPRAEDLPAPAALRGRRAAAPGQRQGSRPALTGTAGGPPRPPPARVVPRRTPPHAPPPDERMERNRMGWNVPRAPKFLYFS